MPDIARRDGVLHEMLDDRAVLVTADGREVITLNPVGSLVWNALERPRSLDELADEIAARFPQTAPDVVRRDVHTFVDSLLDADLVMSSG